MLFRTFPTAYKNKHEHIGIYVWVELKNFYQSKYNYLYLI